VKKEAGIKGGEVGRGRETENIKDSKKKEKKIERTGKKSSGQYDLPQHGSRSLGKQEEDQFRRLGREGKKEFSGFGLLASKSTRKGSGKERAKKCWLHGFRAGEKNFSGERERRREITVTVLQCDLENRRALAS